MPSKNPEIIKRARDTWYAKNKQSQVDKQKLRKRKIKDALLEYKRTLSCIDCGCSFKNNPEWLDFHHTDPLQKENSVNILVEYSLEKVMAEIAKCVPLCANCHRTRHAAIG